MTSPDLAHVTALTFDCYGTLIDWETGAIEALRPLLARHGVAVTARRLRDQQTDIGGSGHSVHARALQPPGDVPRSTGRPIVVDGREQLRHARPADDHDRRRDEDQLEHRVTTVAPSSNDCRAARPQVAIGP